LKLSGDLRHARFARFYEFARSLTWALGRLLPLEDDVLVLSLLAIAALLVWIGVSLSSIVVNSAITATEARDLNRTAEALNERIDTIAEQLDDIRAELVGLTEHNAGADRLEDTLDTVADNDILAELFDHRPRGDNEQDWMHTPGGLTLSVQYRSGSQTSANHLPVIGHVLQRLLGAEPIPGSLNLHAEKPLDLPDPAVRRLYGGVWQFSPVVLAQSAVGIIARRADTAPNAFIEVFAAQHLVSELALAENQNVSIRILSGVALFDAA
jgi:hypothetical protein